MKKFINERDMCKIRTHISCGQIIIQANDIIT